MGISESDFDTDNFFVQRNLLREIEPNCIKKIAGKFRETKKDAKYLNRAYKDEFRKVLFERFDINVASFCD